MYIKCIITTDLSKVGRFSIDRKGSGSVKAKGETDINEIECFSSGKYAHSGANVQAMEEMNEKRFTGQQSGCGI